VGRKKTEISEPVAPAAPGILARLGVVGMEAIEPVVLAALIQQDPLLLIGPHGTGKSYLLNRLAAALGLEHRHYNASLLNFDDLVGYPLPNGTGSLEYVQTPASIWRAQSVFIDEISRCRPDIQNKLFSIIHERRVQGLELERLTYRWSAMNPPAAEDEDTTYAGSEPLDTALADRFAFVLEIPDWQRLSPESQETLILTGDSAVDPEAGSRLARDLETGRALASRIRQSMSAVLARYIRLVCALLGQSGIVLSPRRAVMLLRNIAGVHAARLLTFPDADPSFSALTALRHSLPQRATGRPVKEIHLVSAHKEAWKAAGAAFDDPIHLLMAEPDPLRRALFAARCDALGKREFSTVAADCLAALPAGARHALAAELFESGAAGKLIAAVAEQAAEWCAVTATPQDIHESVQANGTRHRVWKHVVARLAALDKDAPDTASATNLLTGLFGSNELTVDDDVDRALAAWQHARRTIAGAC
jgi:MoxR-like ATPase